MEPMGEDKLQERVYQGLQKKKKCELCQQYFFVDELPGAITFKSILELRQKWGEDPRRGNRMPSPSQLYKRCELCVFCMQFFDVDGLQDAPPSPNQTQGGADGTSSPNNKNLSSTTATRKY